MKLGKPLPPAKDIPLPDNQAVGLVVSQWDTFAPAKYKGLLSAPPIDAKDTKARWFYDADNRRYVSKSGRVLSAKELRAAWLAFHKAINKRKVANVR